MHPTSLPPEALDDLKAALAAEHDRSTVLMSAYLAAKAEFDRRPRRTRS